MGSHFAEVLRQGLWASLTGGWFYDPQMSLFCNTFHLYLWLILFLSPFVLKLTVPKTGVFIAWSLYSFFITVLFITIKTINFQLHKLFDTSEKYDDHTKSKADGNDRWTRLNSASQSIEHIEMEELGQSQSRLVLQSTQAGDDNTGSTSKILADIESRKTKAITSLEAITSMEDLASLPDIKEIEPKKEVSTETLPDQQTASDIEEFKQTIKAILAQATPQTSPLSHRRRALSQDRWSINLGSTPPPTLKRQAPQYLSQRVNRRRNAIYRRRSKSVADSPHGSHMLVGESRTEENPPLTLEWAGYPHPSPRPRHRIRQMSLEEPLHRIPGRRYSLELKPSQRGKGRGVISHSSDTLLKDDRHVLKEGLIKEITDKKKSSILTDSVSEITTSLESGRENKDTEWTTADCEKDVCRTPEQSSESDSLAQSNAILIEVLMPEAPLSVITDSTPRGNTNNSAKEAEDPEKSNTQLDNLPIVEEIGEDRPRNPTPTTASYLGDSNGGAIPKTSHGKSKRSNQYSLNSRKSHGMSSVPLEIRAPSTVLEGESSSPVSSSSGSENTALLVTTKSSFDGSIHHDVDIENSQNRSSSRRLTNEGSFRSSVRQGRYYGSQSSWGSRRSTHRPSVSEPISDKNPGSASNDWHYFQDHTGCWFKYTFSSESDGLPINLGKDFQPGQDSFDAFDLFPRLTDLPSFQSSEESRPNLDALMNVSHPISCLTTDFDRTDSDDRSSEISIPFENAPPATPKTKQFYIWKVFSKFPLRIWLDRLSLMSLLDRSTSMRENVLSIVLAALVSLFASVMLSVGYYNDIWIMFFCFVVAGSQYCLLKSVQPDAASPTHGFNNVILYSRAAYFCVLCSLIILMDVCITELRPASLKLYGVDLITSYNFVYAKELLKVLLLCLPLVFTLGLLPQVTTFSQYLLEQIEIHVFGGNGTTSLFAAFYSVLHSIFAAALLYGMAVISIQSLGTDVKKIDEVPQHVSYSVFMAVLIGVSYHYSRMSSDPTHLLMLLKPKVALKQAQKSAPEVGEEETTLKDPLPEQIKQSLYQRLRNDLIVSVIAAVFVFGIHVSTVFSGKLQPVLHDVLCYVTVSVGFLTHYLLMQLRKEYPWLCCSHPLLKTHESSQFNVNGPPAVTWFETLYVWLRCVEKNFLYPAVLMSGISTSTPTLLKFFGLNIGPLVVVICSFKSFRNCFSDTPSQYCVLALTQLFFSFDFAKSPEKDMFILNYALMSIFFSKFVDFYLKCKFIFAYIAPWQLAWGSAFHAFAQPLSIPHACMLFVQAAISAVFYTPLNPFLGSAIFINSYARPIKFWEKDYNTKRVDNSNMRLASQVEHNHGSDDNNLNSIFYEHLTRSLQKMLCGDLMIGRWGQVQQGDMFIMASDYLNALVHIIEMGNGLVTFQLRGLEFRGTYCQQREVEAITEGVEDDAGCFCCNPGHLPHFLSLNAAFGERWLAWEVTVTMYILDGYSISDNNAASMLQVYDLRKVLISYYVKAVIFYATRSPHLSQWLEPEGITSNINTNEEMAGVFSAELDEDYDRIAHNITQKQFCRIYLPWISYCASKRPDVPDIQPLDSDSRLVRLCYALSLVARRALATAAINNLNSTNVEFLLCGLHSLFKGDFRITGPDEWIFQDIELLHKVLSPAIRMALKLHQDHFSLPDEYSDHGALYDTIIEHVQSLIVTHEADPNWRNAVLSNRPSLLALRHVFDEGTDLYKVIMLNKRHLSFRIIKVNRECVRGLWAGQQQELVFLRNRNPERGSIQNAKQALRNMINSSCDQPIGYPIYVSPLTTSYAASNEQLCSIIGGEVSLARVKRALIQAWHQLRLRCGHTCRNISSPDVLELQAIHSVHNNTSFGGGDNAREPGVRASDVRLGVYSHMRQSAKASSSSLPISLAGLTRGSGSVKDKLEQPSSSAANNLNQEQSSTETELNSRQSSIPEASVMSLISRGKRSDPQWLTSEITKTAINNIA